MAFLIPPLLKSGGSIGVMAPSSYVEREDIEASKAFLEKAGYTVFIHPQTYERHNQSAGTDLQKALALQGLWQRADIDVIWAAGGGNRCASLLRTLNFDKMVNIPKALIGFSDATALLNGITAKTGIVSYHGPVFKQLHSHAGTQGALDVLSGVPQTHVFKEATVLYDGEANGPLIGGCLSVFQTLIGTPYMPAFDGALLFLEDSGDHISRFDRMLIHLKNAGILNGIAGLVLGEFRDLQDGARRFGFSIEDSVRDLMEGLDIPVMLGCAFGHGAALPTFPIGAPATMNTRKHSLSNKAPKTT